MDKFLEIVGMLGVVLVLLAMILIVLSVNGDMKIVALLGVLPWAVPAIIGCVIIAAFGNMLEQLKAIRAATERQAEAFQKIADRRPTA